MALSFKDNLCCEVARLPRDAEVLMGRAELLERGDRDLLEAILVRGQTIGSISRMTGVSPRSVSNRVRRLLKRLASRGFMNAARALSHLSQEKATLARLRYCAGISERQLARRYDVSSHVIRRRLDRIGAEIETLARVRRRARGLAPLSRPAGV